MAAVDIAPLRADLVSVRERVLYLHGVLNKSSALSYWDTINLWYAALRLRSCLDTTIAQLEASSHVDAAQTQTLLDDVLAFEDQMHETFELIAKKKPEADALSVSPYVRPFVLELADRAKKWSIALQRIAPDDAKTGVDAFATRLEGGFSKAIEAYT